MARCLLPFLWPWRLLRTRQALVRHARAEYSVDNGLEQGNPRRQPSIDLGTRGSAMRSNVPAQAWPGSKGAVHPVIQTQGPGTHVARTVRGLLECRSAVAAALDARTRDNTPPHTSWGDRSAVGCVHEGHSTLVYNANGALYANATTNGGRGMYPGCGHPYHPKHRTWEEALFPFFGAGLVLGSQ